MGEPALDPEAARGQVRAAAQAFAAGRDGLALLPAELQAAVRLWQQQLRSAGEVLDLEGWLLGLLTLTCLSRGDSRRPTEIEGPGSPPADSAEHWAGVSPAKRIG